MLDKKSGLIAPAITELITSIRKTLTQTPATPRTKNAIAATVVADDLVTVRTLIGLETTSSSLTGSLYVGPEYSGKGVEATGSAAGSGDSPSPFARFGGAREVMGGTCARDTPQLGQKLTLGASFSPHCEQYGIP
jgi:hypothetical protein